MTDVQVAIGFGRESSVDLIQFALQVFLDVVMDKVTSCTQTAVVFHDFFFSHWSPSYIFIRIRNISQHSMILYYNTTKV